jgi:hypothetical protein
MREGYSMTGKAVPIDGDVKRTPITDPGLDKLVQILQSYEPERIILFGSRARDEADE